MNPGFKAPLMKHFNLTESPWIPVRILNSENRLIGLSDLFKQAAEIADLDCPPHERISIMRLLVCITQASLGAPESSEDWDEFGDEFETQILTYLARSDIHPNFNLYGDGPRFFQQLPKQEAEGYPIDQIMFQLSTGNSTTLLDHEGGTARKFPPATVARAILAYQNFFVGGSMASKVKGNGPALKFLNCLLRGANLKESILVNCLDLETVKEYFQTISKPSWESSSQVSVGYLGRLSPRSCALWLAEDGFSLNIDMGVQQPEFPEQRDPYSTTHTYKDKSYLLRADLEKGLWKDLHVVTVLKNADDQGQQAPLNLQSHALEYQDKKCEIWLGELVKAKDAKIIDSIESTFTVPVKMFSDEGRGRYQSGVEYAEKQSNHLYGAVKQYGDSLKQDKPPTGLAKQYYWTALQHRSQTLLDLVAQEDAMSIGYDETGNPWGELVRNSAIKAYEQVCPRLSPRQLQAYAAGLRRLRIKRDSHQTTKTAASKS